MMNLFQVLRCSLLVAASLALILSPGLLSAGTKNIGFNVKRAGVIMAGVDEIKTTASGKENLPRELRGLGITEYKQFNNRFKEDIDFLMAVSDSHVYIGYKGTHNDANKKLNRRGAPLRPFKSFASIVHKGWWRVVRKSYKHEIKDFLDEHADGKTILVTGHSLGGALAAYTARRIQLDEDHQDRPLRLVTFGAPRYTNDDEFFTLGNDVDFWVFTVEMTKENRCVDDTVYSWQKHLLLYRLTAPKNRSGDKVWHGRCKTTHTTYGQAHNLKNYIKLSEGRTCNHIALRRDCKATKKAAKKARN